MLYQPNSKIIEHSESKPSNEGFSNLCQIFENDGLNHLAEVARFAEQNGPLKQLVVLGSGINSENGKIEPKNINKMNILAAVILKSLGLVQNIIITGGHTNENTVLSEAEVSLHFLVDHFGEEFVKEIEIETTSNSTLQNAQNIVPILKENSEPNQTVGIIGQQWHVNPRARSLFQEVLTANGYNLDLALSSNQILKDFIIYLQRHIQELKATNPFIAEKLWFMSLEMKLILSDFEHLDPFFGDGSKYGQLGVAAAYMLPPVRKQLEGVANQKRDHNKEHSLES